MQNSLTIVIFGATGNLYADKLAKALYLLFIDGKLPKIFEIIAFGRKDFKRDAFQTLTKEHILKRGEVDREKLDEFVSHIEYLQGDFLGKDDFTRLKNSLKNFLSSEKNGLIVFHLATASILYPKIFENMKDAELHDLAGEVRLMIEKPFGKDEFDAKNLQDKLCGIFENKNIFHVDHYLAKETVQNLRDFKLDKESVKKIKIIFHESNVVGSRGGYYDKVGAFRDVGQNHMLQMLALVIMDKGGRLNALNNLYIDEEEKMTRAQYEDYHKELGELGVDPHSETETFFRVFLRSKNPELSNISFELEGGKGLADTHSDVTTTTVAIEIIFNNGKKEELKIQPVPDTVYESYTKVYTDVFAGDQTNFPSIEEIILEWKLADELLEKWKDIPLVIYKKGSRAEQIK